MHIAEISMANMRQLNYEWLGVSSYSFQ
jgi:hypothetical protein